MITVLCFLYVLPKLAFEVEKFDVIKYEAINDTGSVSHATHFCIIHYHSFVRFMGEANYFSTLFFIRVILFVLLPCILLIIFSIILIITLRKAQIRRKILLKFRRSESKRESSTTAMLAVVTIIFLVVNLPQGILLTLFCISMSTGQSFLNQNTFNLINIVDNLLIMATFPINFAIYCSMSKQFRITFRALFVREEFANVARRLDSTVSLPLFTVEI